MGAATPHNDEDGVEMPRGRGLNLIFTRIKRTGPEDRRQLRNLRHALQAHVAQDGAGIASAAASSSSNSLLDLIPG